MQNFDHLKPVAHYSTRAMCRIERLRFDREKTLARYYGLAAVLLLLALMYVEFESAAGQLSCPPDTAETTGQPAISRIDRKSNVD